MPSEEDNPYRSPTAPARPDAADVTLDHLPITIRPPLFTLISLSACTMICFAGGVWILLTLFRYEFSHRWTTLFSEVCGGIFVFALGLVFLTAMFVRTIFSDSCIEFRLFAGKTFQWSEIDNWRIADRHETVIFTTRDGVEITLPGSTMSKANRRMVRGVFRLKLGYESEPGSTSAT